MRVNPLVATNQFSGGISQTTQQLFTGSESTRNGKHDPGCKKKSVSKPNQFLLSFGMIYTASIRALPSGGRL